MVDTGLIEEQVLNSIIDATPESKNPSQKGWAAELTVNVLDIWGPDKVERWQIDIWGSGKERPEPSTEEVKKTKGEEIKGEQVLKTEYEEEKEVPEEESKEKEAPIASIWELLMNSKIHKEALVRALDQKKFSMVCTPDQMVNSLMESLKGAVIFTDEDLPLEGRDHQRALFIKAEVKGKLTCCVLVDNGSAINVCPLKILPKLGLMVDDLQASDVVIKA